MNPSGHILVIDDDDGIREFVSTTLADEGYQVATAPHGAAALEYVAVDEPALILLDMRMPVMDGWEFMRMYRKRPGPHAPVIILTAARDAGQYAQETQADNYLGKPFNLEELLDLVAIYTHPPI